MGEQLLDYGGHRGVEFREEQRFDGGCIKRSERRQTKEDPTEATRLKRGISVFLVFSDLFRFSKFFSVFESSMNFNLLFLGQLEQHCCTVGRSRIYDQ